MKDGPNRPIIEVRELKNFLGNRWVHNGLNLEIYRGEIVAIIGGSGCGKTTLMRTILMLQRATSGTVKVFDIDVQQCNSEQAKKIRQRWGVMFQSSALFSSLSVVENVMFPMEELTDLTGERQRATALLKLSLAGLELEAASKYPGELSGGMKKRVALARAIALDPELVFLDEPASGLDPKSAGELDDLVLHLRENLGLTFVIITHDLDTLWSIPDRVVFLGEGKVLAAMPMKELIKNDHPVIQEYFSGPRGQNRALWQEEKQERGEV